MPHCMVINSLMLKNIHFEYEKREALGKLLKESRARRERLGITRK